MGSLGRLTTSFALHCFALFRVVLQTHVKPNPGVNVVRSDPEAKRQAQLSNQNGEPKAQAKLASPELESNWQAQISSQHVDSKSRDGEPKARAKLAHPRREPKSRIGNAQSIAENAQIGIENV
jgi:hypothetical protein